MPQVTIEYMIMIPLLIMQIFLFPFTANWLMNVWVDSRRTLALQDAASHLGSTIQQMYSCLNHETMGLGTRLVYLPGLPPSIEDHHFIGTAKLRAVLGSAQNSSKNLDLTLKLASTGISVVASTILGPNVKWIESTFMSNSTNAHVSAGKYSNGTIWLRFGG